MDDAVSRRSVLCALSSAGALSLAGCSALQREPDGQATDVGAERARELATRFAPTLFFDDHESWFPTDPRPYESERDGETVVDGFDALDGYHERYGDDTPPDPTVFYHVVRYEDSPLAVVQYWLYSAFDQFTTNFHWHDWEVLHVFVDADSGDPQLYVASSHSRRVPNNEFLDPDSDAVPYVLSELGSHSSAISLNEERSEFERFDVGDLFADITNTAIEGVQDLSEIPMAYGLPRDEGMRLPYLVPEYEGVPVHEHERLPAVTRDSLVSEALTVRSFDALDSPPTDLPTRQTGLRFQHRDRAGDADVEYELVPTSDVEHIADFTGPQLSFEFSVPQFAEDAVASHISTAGAPWNQARYENPAADVSDPRHRRTLAERYDAIGDPAPVNAVVAQITQTVTSDDAPENEGVTTTESAVESVALLESDPVAVPTFGGAAVAQDVPSGDHRLTVNGAGQAPHSEQLSVDDGDSTAAGVGGEIPLVARRDARKLEVAAENAEATIARVAVEDDFAGRLYDSAVEGNDAVYVHAGGAYTTEVRDVDDAIGAYRVNPDPDAQSAVRIDRPQTGKAALATFLVDVAEETRREVSDLRDDTDVSNAVRGLTRALAAVAEAAERAAGHAKAGERANANRRLAAVSERLQRVSARLSEAEDDIPETLSNAVENRVAQATRRAEQAKQSQKL